MFKLISICFRIASQSHTRLPYDWKWRDGPEQLSCLPTDAIVLVDSATSEPPGPYVLIYLPPSQEGLPASLSKHLLFKYISPAYQLSGNESEFTIMTIVALSN
jgi:hypothetical protein